MVDQPLEQLAEIVRESGLIEPGSRGVALLSGGPDSACLAAGLVMAGGAEAITGLHVNYGFRPDSGEDEDAARELCQRLGLELEVMQVQLDADSTNLQAAAREARYEIGENLRARLGGDWIATGHTRNDLAETVLYRLASSPGRRAMLGLAPRRGYVVRPLLAIGRADTRRLATEAELPFHDDPSNIDPGFARVRIREEVLPVLREINPAAEENVAATWAELAEEAEALEKLAAEVLEENAAAPGAALQAERLAELHLALRRLVLRALAERSAGRDVALGPERCAEIWRLAQRPEGGEVDLGGSLRAICEAGLIRFATRSEAEPEPAELPVPGSCRFGRWEIHAEVRPGPVEPSGPEVATLDAAALGGWLEVRAWREGDSMRPLGLDGTKSLQDLFTDNHVPRSLRHSLPVVAASGRIAWVAGVAVSEEFKLGPDSTEAAVLTANLTG
jgi:tRNA(Ile)-lysidine synthase